MSEERSPTHLAQQSRLLGTGQGGGKQPLYAGLLRGGSAGAHNWSLRLVRSQIDVAHQEPADEAADHDGREDEQDDGEGGGHRSGLGLNFSRLLDTEALNKHQELRWLPLGHLVKRVVDFACRLDFAQAHALGNAGRHLRHDARPNFGEQLASLGLVCLELRCAGLVVSLGLRSLNGYLPINVGIELSQAPRHVQQSVFECHTSRILSGWLRADEFGHEKIGAENLHSGRDAARFPVMNTLRTADLVIAKQFSHASRAAKGFNELVVFHAAIKHRVYLIVNTVFVNGLFS